MADNIKLRFFRNTGIPSDVAQGDIVFNPQTRRIGVWNGTSLEEYGGEVQNVTFSETGILSITKKAKQNENGEWENEVITLDFSDVASASDVTKVVGGLKELVDAQGQAISTLQSTVGSSSSGLVKDVATLKDEVEKKDTGLLDRVSVLENNIGAGENALGGRVQALEEIVGNENSGLVQQVNTHSTAITTLQNDKANKSEVYTKNDVYTKSETESAIDAKISSTYKASGTIAPTDITSTLLTSTNEGKVYNVSDVINITDSNKDLFVEGVKGNYPAGSNIVVINTGTLESPIYKFDILAGFVDLTAYAKTADQKVITDDLDRRIDILEAFKDGEDGYKYVQNITSTHTNTTDGEAPKDMLSVTTNTKATGEVTININESVLDTTLKQMKQDIGNASASAAAGVRTFGGQSGAIGIDSNPSNNWGAKFSMGGADGKVLMAEIKHDGKLDKYNSAGSAATPIYIASDGTPTVVSIESTEATNGGTNLVTSGAAFAAINKAITNNNATLDSLNWASF